MDERLQHIDMNGGFANQKGIIEDTDMKRTLDMTVPERIGEFNCSSGVVFRKS